MAQFLTRTGIVNQIENIIISSKSWIILVSPFLKLSQNVLERLQDADKNNVPILIIYGKDALLLDEREKLQKLKNLQVRFCRNLHAKCYINEKSLVITSMNMHEFSEQSNREMGVLYNKKDEGDKQIYLDTLTEVQSIIRASYEDSEKKEEPIIRRPKRKTTWNMDVGDAVKVWFPTFTKVLGATKQGYCIRCRKRIPHDLDASYCYTCFSEWVRYGGNPTYIERDGHCHTCGRHAQTSRLRPECSSCYWK